MLISSCFPQPSTVKCKPKTDNQQRFDVTFLPLTTFTALSAGLILSLKGRGDGIKGTRYKSKPKGKFNPKRWRAIPGLLKEK
jgi:hypothetical protein